MQILAAVLLIAILVFIHEFGHFVVAKACGVQVPVFSIGFGRRLVGIEIGGTDYRISALPFGGYVRMAGADPFGTGEEDDEFLEDKSKAFLRRPVWQRLLVVLAGPAFNLILPIVVFTGLYMAGDPKPAAELGSVRNGTYAESAGLLPGDQVLSINGVELETAREMAEQLSSLTAGTHELSIVRGGDTLSLDLVLPEGFELSDLGMQPLRPDATIGVDDPTSPAAMAGLVTGDVVEQIDGQEVAYYYQIASLLSEGSVLGVRRVDGSKASLQMGAIADWEPAHGQQMVAEGEAWGLTPATLFVGSVESSVQQAKGGFLSGCAQAPTEPKPTPAALAGIQAGDRVLTIDGQLIRSWSGLIQGVGAAVEGEGEDAVVRSLQLSVVREGQVIELELTPEVVEDVDALGRYQQVPRVGIMRMGQAVYGPDVVIEYGFGEAFSLAAEDTVAITGFILEQIGKLLVGEAAMEKSVGGPVEMVRQAKAAVEDGLLEYARFMALLSISLGIVNLLPVPVLDGGQALFFLMESVRGRPVSVAFRERAQQIGVLFLVALMLAVLVMDINRLFQG